MGETLHLLFRRRENGAFELQVRENWSGRAVSGSFVPPYTGRQLNALHKKLNKFNNSIPDLRDIGYRLFLALCGSETPGTSRRELSEQSVQAMLRSVIQRTLRRRGTVALTFSFAPDCDLRAIPGNCSTMVNTFCSPRASFRLLVRSFVLGRPSAVICLFKRQCACSTSAPLPGIVLPWRQSGAMKLCGGR